MLATATRANTSAALNIARGCAEQGYAPDEIRVMLGKAPWSFRPREIAEAIAALSTVRSPTEPPAQPKLTEAVHPRIAPPTCVSDVASCMEAGGYVRDGSNIDLTTPVHAGDVIVFEIYEEDQYVVSRWRKR